MELIEERRKILLNTPHIEELSTNTFQTNMIAPMKKCEVQFLPMQSGTGNPSPDNIRPITGYNNITVRQSGKNLFNPSSFDTKSNPLTLDNDPTSSNYGFYGGSITGWSNNYKTDVSDYGISDFALGVEQLTISAIVKSTDGSNFVFRFCFVYSDGTVDYNGGNITATGTENRVSRTSKSNKTVVGYFITSSSSASNRKGLIKDVQVEIGSLTSFEPYQSLRTYTTNLGVSEIYGGIVDLVTGILTVNFSVKVIDGTTNKASGLTQMSETSEWTYLRGLYTVQLVDLPNDIPYNTGESICSHFNWYTYTARRIAQPNSIYYSSSGRAVRWGSDTYTTLEQFNQYLVDQFNNGTPVTLVYPRGSAEITTYQLTPQQIKTLKKTNTFFADNGSVIKVMFWKHMK